MNRDPPCLHFGGPDRPARFLRDLLKQRVEAVPAGGEIAWATYYFRDLELADALVAACDRGVKVRVHIEGCPRRTDANDAVIARLSAHGLDGNLRIHRSTVPWKRMRPYLHAKIYVFSHPEPSALIGSFNPSGNLPDDPLVIADIGDQDRGHNLLAEYRDPTLVMALSAHIAGIGRFAQRLRPTQNKVLRSAESSIWLFPRLQSRVIDHHLAGLGSGCRIRGAISHLKTGSLSRQLGAAVSRGAAVRLLVHDTERRVPEEVVAVLEAAGVAIDRYVAPDDLPLHSKFLLIDEPGACTAYFGSFNFNPRAQMVNHEVLVGSRDAAIINALSSRFDAMESELGQLQLPG